MTAMKSSLAICDEFLSKLLLDYNNVVVTIGGEVFNHRMQVLHAWFDSHKVAVGSRASVCRAGPRLLPFGRLWYDGPEIH